MAEEHKSQPKRHYAVLSTDSIQAFAEAGGHSNLSADLAAMLSEDVVYRLRELIQSSCQYACHAKRMKVTTEDFNKALHHSDALPILGHGTTDSVKWRQTKEGELSFQEDMDTGLANLACTSHAPLNPGSTIIRAHWLAVEGTQKPSVLGSTPAADQPSPQMKTVSSDLLEYHDAITKAILSNNQDILKVALDDLRTNPKISPLLPHLVSFIANGVKKLSHDAGQLTKLLATIRALLHNKALFLQPKPYMSLMVESVLVCLLEPLAASFHPLHDHWLLRDVAARLLATLVHEWGTVTNKLTQQVIVRLRSVLYNTAKPFSSQYGAISALLALGLQTFEEVVFSHLTTYWPHLQAALNDPSVSNYHEKQDAGMVRGILLMGAEYLLLAKRRSLISYLQMQKLSDKPCKGDGVDVSAASPAGRDVPCLDPSDPLACISEVNSSEHRGSPYPIAYELLGDSLAAGLPCSPVDIYTQPSLNSVVSLKDQNDMKSGEELLEQFLNVSAFSQGRRRGRGLDEYDSYGPSPDDLDYEGDEHSSRSEHSDNLSFIDEDLTVKATVSDPSRGIKLFIAKKPKSKTSEAESMDSGSENKATPPRILMSRKPPLQCKDIFDVTHPVKRDKTFVFHYAGRLQRCKMIERRKSTLVDPLPPSPQTDNVYVPNVFPGQKLYGKRLGADLKSRHRYHMALTCDCFI